MTRIFIPILLPVILIIIVISSITSSVYEPKVQGEEAVNTVDDGVSFDSYANETERISVDFVYDPVIVGEEIIIITGQLDPYHPGEYLEVDMYTPQGEVIVSERINEESPTWPGYVDDTGSYRFRFNPLDVVNSTETIEGLWAVRLSYGEATVSEYITVQYQREEGVEEHFWNDDIAEQILNQTGKLTEENFDEYENPAPVNPVDDGVTVVGELPIPVTGELAEECRELFASSFLLLHLKDNASYAFVVDHLTEIRCVEEVGDGHVGHVSWNGIYFTEPTTWHNDEYGIADRAGALVHESCHVMQFERQNWFLRWIKWQPYGEKVEVECMMYQLETLNNLGFDNGHLRKMIEDPEYRKAHKYW